MPLDYAQLRAEGLALLERLAGDQWTDFNAHDPGITILEQICYAMADLAYRTGHSVADLLASGGADPTRDLPGPDAVLGGTVATLDDLRKLVLDVEGVRNAWIEPTDETALPVFSDPATGRLLLTGDASLQRLHLKGLYRVLIDKADTGFVDEASVVRRVAIRLHAHRGLCEDFEIRVLATAKVRVSAEIELAPGCHPERALGEIYRSIENYLSPGVPFRSFREATDAGRRMEDLFEGPLLDHGFVEDADLARTPRRTEVRTSDLIRALTDLPEVRAIRQIGVSLGASGTLEPWVLQLPDDHVGVFDLAAAGRSITLFRDHLPVQVDAARVVRDHAARSQRTRAVVATPDLRAPRGRDRQVQRYGSVQEQFPEVYGIGRVGLPASASPARRAQARQLGAYLMLFDQILANGFAQLGHVGSLLSLDPAEPGTYRAGEVQGTALEELRGPDHDDWLRDHIEAPGAGEDQQAAMWRRRNLFLDHLLARFGEDFGDYAMILFDGLQRGEVSLEERLGRDKQAFLRQIAVLHRDRGTGRNILATRGTRGTGLEERLHRKLGLDRSQGEAFRLVEHILLRPLPEDAGQGSRGVDEPPLLQGIRETNPYSLQVTYVFAAAGRLRVGDSPFRRFVEQTLREETPAHVCVRTAWLDDAAWRTFEQAYIAWMERHRSYWAHHYGI